MDALAEHRGDVQDRIRTLKSSMVSSFIEASFY